MISLILLIFGLVFFVLATFKVQEPVRFNFIGAGLACWILKVILAGHIQ